MNRIKKIEKKVRNLHNELQDKHDTYCLSNYGRPNTGSKGIYAVLVVGKDQDAIWDYEHKNDDVLEAIDLLDKDITARIEETHRVKGMQAERHAFCYYREKLWEIKKLIK